MARDGSENLKGSVTGVDSEVSWVGEQHRMAGYCGRMIPVVGAETGIGADIPAAVTVPGRVGLLGRPRRMVVRIGPKSCGECVAEASMAA